MGLVDREQSAEPVRGRERALELKAGSLGGFELRPTRLFVWKGPERAGHERLVPLDDQPAALDYSRRETSTRAGPVELRTLGNPLMTIALAGAVALRKWADAPDETRRKPSGRPDDSPEP